MLRFKLKCYAGDATFKVITFLKTNIKFFSKGGGYE